MTTGAMARGIGRGGEQVWRVPAWALAGIVLLYLVLGSSWSLIVPLGEGPDEPAHLQYALFLRTRGALPVQTAEPTTSDVPGEGHQPPLAYLLMQPLVDWLDGSELTLHIYGNPLFRWNGGSEPNAYLHGLQERPPYGGVILAWHLVRLLSVVLGAVSIVACYATVRYVWPDAPGLAIGAAALVAFNPQWLFHHALVSNDPLLIMLSSWLLFLAIVAAQPDAPASAPATPRRVWLRDWGLPVLGGGLLGLMLLTKQSALALAPVPVLGLWLGRKHRRIWLLQTLVVVGVALLISGWWYARNRALYGDWMGLRVFQQTFGAGDFEFRYWQSWWNGGRDLLRSSIAMFGWMTLPLPNGFFAIAGAGLVVAGLGLLASIGSGIWQGRGRVALVTLVACGGVLAWTAAFAVTTGAVAWQGRFLFPAAPALGLLLAVGLVSALPRRAGLVAFTTVGLLLGTVLPFTFIRPIYQSPALAATEVPRGSIYDRFDFGWKRGFELQDATFARVVPTRSTMLVGLTWHLVEPVDRPWFVFLHLVDDQEQIVAKRDAQPLEGRIPTTAWVPGDWFRDEQHLVLTDVAPGAYHLRIGLWDPRTTRRLGVYDRDGQLRGDYVDLGAVTVTRK